MKTILILLLCIGDGPFDFIKKPEPKSPAPMQIEEEKESRFVGPIDNPQAKIDALEQEHQAELVKVEAAYQDKLKTLQESHDETKHKVEKLSGVYESEANWRDNKIKALETENSQLRAGIAKLREQNASHERTIASIPQIEMTDFSQLERGPQVQMVLTTSPSCPHCKPLIDNLVAKLAPQGYTISDTDPTAMIFVKHITQQQWNAAGFSLPRIEIVTRGQSRAIDERDPYKLGRLLNAAVVAEQEMPPLPGEQVAGMAVATVPGKAQVTQMLTMLEPFLDGGTLQVIYTSKPGVIKKFLTIKQGPIGIKIPPKTTFELAMKNGDLTIRMLDPKPELLLGPLDRGVQEIDITPNKISVRLPWMIDPELKLK